MMPFKATQKGDKFKFLILNRVSVGVEMTFIEGYCYSLCYNFKHLPD